jgi:hypothetical protein
MTGENRDKPRGPPGFWGDAGADEPGPLSLGAWPKPDDPATDRIEPTGPIELPPQLKAMAARWERPASPAPRKLKPPTKRFFTPLPEPTFGAPEPQLPAPPLTPAAEAAPAEPGTIVLRLPRPLFWACLFGVVVGGLVAMMLDVAQVRRNQPVLLPPKPDRPAVAVQKPDPEQPTAKAATRSVKAARRPPPPRTYVREPSAEFAPQRSITILNAPPKVVVLRPAPAEPEPDAP